MKDKKTLVVNLFAGPGSGKSTGAAYVFSQLKMAGIDAEYVSEYAKDKVWEQDDEVFKCQFYVTGKQAFRISRVNSKVDVIITDSPILQGITYAGPSRPGLKEAILEEHKIYNNLNILIKRVKPYNPNGRMQTLDEAKKIDKEIEALLKASAPESYTAINGTKEGYDTLVSMILSYLKKEK